MRKSVKPIIAMIYSLMTRVRCAGVFFNMMMSYFLDDFAGFDDEELL